MPNVKTMPSTAYNRTISTIRDYPRMVYEVERLRRDTASVKATNYSGMPSGGTPSGMDDKIARLVDLERDVEKMREVIDTIPEDMRDGIMNNVMYGIGFPRNRDGYLVPSIATWKREKQKFIVLMAHKMRIY